MDEFKTETIIKEFKRIISGNYPSEQDDFIKKYKFLLAESIINDFGIDSANDIANIIHAIITLKNAK